jgi:hypothetical protein
LQIDEAHGSILIASAAAKPLAKRKPNGTAINGYIHSPLPS